MQIDVCYISPVHISAAVCIFVTHSHIICILRINAKQVVKVIWHRAASSPHTDGSIVFTRWRKCAPVSTPWAIKGANLFLSNCFDHLLYNRLTIVINKSEKNFFRKRLGENSPNSCNIFQLQFLLCWYYEGTWKKAKFHYAIWSHTGPKLVADLQRAEIRPII